MKERSLGLDGKILLAVGCLLLVLMLGHLVGRGFHRHPPPPQVEVGE